MFLGGCVFILLCVYVISTAPFAGMAALLLLVAETTGGVCTAATVLAGLCVPILVLLAVALKRHRKFVLLALGFCVVVTAGLGVVAVFQVPRGENPEAAPVQSLFLGEAQYTPLSPANLVPEIDQLKLGSYIIPAIDPVIDVDQAERIRELFGGVYREMRDDPEFEQLGSVMNYTYRDIVLAGHDTGHMYTYIPPGYSEPLPTIVFLHGAFGNFKGYMWVWKQFADTYGVAIVAPSFGMGMWDTSDSEQTIAAAVDYCTEHPQLRSGDLYLAGLSNGGIGVMVAVARLPTEFAGYIFISPVMPPSTIDWTGRRVLVIHGDADRRISAADVKNAAQRLEALGADLVMYNYAEEDHFLFFSQPAAVLSDVGRWLEAGNSDP